MRGILIILLFWVGTAVASYRVFQLKVEHFNFQGKVSRTQTVLSTLDPNQYASYHAGHGSIRVKMEDTWFCPGDTGGYRDYCEKPKVKQRAPSSLDDPKRTQLPYNRQPVVP